MAKINFTKEHFDKMCSLLLTMLLSNNTVNSKLGTPINVVELVMGEDIIPQLLHLRMK